MYDAIRLGARCAGSPTEMQQLFAALRGNQDETDRFIGIIAGTVSIPEFFSPESMGRIIGS